ncbi:MAG: KTSC domain-containing protein [Bradyrhizobium sp.]
MIRSAAALLALLSISPVTTEPVELSGGREVDLAPFACTDTPRSTVVQRVCYDEARRHLLVNVGGAYSEYCNLPAATFQAFVVAPSMGQFFRQSIAAATPFTCEPAN